MASTFAERTSGRANNFDLLRLLLASLVIFSHSWPILQGDDVAEPLRVASRGQMFFGALAVNLFFVMSGFLITMSWETSRGLGDYLRKRVLRIYPGFIVAALLSWLVFAPLGGGSPGAASPLQILLSVTTLTAPKVPGAFVKLPLAGAVNDSMWTIRHEFLCYLAVPALGALGFLRRRALALAGLVALLAGVAFFTWVRRVPDLPLLRPELGILRLGTYFAAGACFYLYRDQIPRSAALLGVAMVSSLTAIFLGGLSIVFPLAGTYIAFYAAFADPIDPSRASGQKPDYSYGVYLYAFPVQQLLTYWIGPSLLGPLSLFAAALPATFLCAFASWHLIERPSLRLKARR